MNKYVGWLNVYKPINISSFGVLKKIKKKFNLSKIGHAGTLDPLAEGILPIAIGNITKLIPFINDAIKEYEFEIKWGEQTSTDDREGEIINVSSYIPKVKENISVGEVIVKEEPVIDLPIVESASEQHVPATEEEATHGTSPESQPTIEAENEPEVIDMCSSETGPIVVVVPNEADTAPLEYMSRLLASIKA